MNNINTKHSNKKDNALYTLMTLFTFGVLFCVYYLTFSSPIHAMIWLGWFTLMVFLGYQTTRGKQVFEFALEAKMELMKVVWPTRPETVQTTTIVMVMVTFTGFILWGIDSMMMWAIAKITHLG